MSNKRNGTDPAGSAPDVLGEERWHSVLDVRIMPRGRRWKWQVCNQHGVMLMRGWETSRTLARYRGYRALLLLLRANCVQAPLRAERNPDAPAADATEADATEKGATEKGRPVTRTAFPVSRRRHI